MSTKIESPIEATKNIQVSVDSGLLRKVRIAAAASGMTAPEYILDRLTPVVDSDLACVARTYACESMQFANK